MALSDSDGTSENYKHWIWVTSAGKHNVGFQELYLEYSRSNVYGLFFEFDDEDHFHAARQAGLKTHRWIWTLNNGDQELMANHPEWYALNRNGDSCVSRPPYVDYYRWLCPNQKGVLKYLEKRVEEILEKENVDGIHLDYIRYCDVILPVSLWDVYGIKQTEELPQYDYCYCQFCRKKFMAQHGIDPLNIKFPDQCLSWRKFRYDSVTNLVNRLSAVASRFKKQITVAVFPTPEVAKRLVRQDWSNWNVNAIYPMIYHRFYDEEVPWIGSAVQEGIRSLRSDVPLFAGLFLPDFKNANELMAAFQTAIANGAAGLSLFGKPDKEILNLLRSFSHKAETK